MGVRQTNASFGQLLKMAREKKGLTQRELSGLSKVSFSQISKFELDLRRPTKDDLDKIKRALQVPTEYFFLQRSKADANLRYEIFLRDFDEVRKLKLDEDQMTTLHWVIKRILLEVSMDSARRA